MENKIKVAVIGVGRWGKSLIKDFSQETEIVSICHKGSAETDKFIKENFPGVSSTSDFESILQNPEIEAVVVATPTTTHFEIASKVLALGKHLFLEKPAGTSSKEIEKIIDKAQEKNLVFSVGYKFPHHKAWQKILEIIPKEEIKSIQMEWFKWGTFDDSAITNLLCHDISLLVSLGLEINPDRHSTYRAITDTDIVETTFDCGNFSSTSYINRVSPEKRKTVTVVGEKDTLIWNNNSLSKINFTNNSLEPIEIEDIPLVSEEARDFVRAIREKSSPRISGKFALDVFRILEKIGF